MTMWTKNPVKLKPEERKELKQLITKGAEKARKITRARILLLAHEGKTDTHIIEALKTARNTIRAVRSRYIQEGL
ncbi:MAG TPA: helix-turn-helix domain-containing protein, partial [Nitrospirae bacterium]|nr:helix-turn-helix domain-containing protein [Nitrospirota bacterium]